MKSWTVKVHEQTPELADDSYSVFFLPRRLLTFRSSCRHSCIRMKRLLLSLLIIAAFASRAVAELPFVQDNYKQALAQAKQRKQPIFVECWAPW
jgi:hypothetical protein